ncbi:S-methyl-5'-thioadenosine phosphorylase [Sphaeroforma arctica JP610]|uniref:S-methyl-5'-thioadenosine phosphorylase n=1 Tax=Sphaeroforma arctica JP610 TaxID=667725 RepID=A0A0L0FL09_9EUKA|nr:S-methyl-5'-thioadenosine phosphorylase [Sphaeroforma arctica JP610]KNC77455.1 S-methyl-5'-thioadenosine phosphorylase [Sphaeroforma arctica JP610]|eukprot:XP_014151357.1 S-methyl-5'-thioadenosine phosphorylase [Sphaeroforma arctica JP610]
MYVGIIGGTGLDDPDFLADREEKYVDTPFGKPSDALIIGKIGGVDCVLLARHDRAHTTYPSNINFRANVWALKQEGCTHVVVSTACGSLREEIAPGHLVVLDQGIDRTTKRASTFYDNSAEGIEGVCHVPMGDPFHPRLRQVVIDCMKDLDITHHTKGTMVSIEGPRFSTRAESLMFRAWGGDVINMTTFPEVALAKEAGIMYASVAAATDYDCWHESEEQVNVMMVLKTMKNNATNLQKLFLELVPRIGKMDWTDDITEARDTVQNAVMLPRAIEQAFESIE